MARRVYGNLPRVFWEHLGDCPLALQPHVLHRRLVAVSQLPVHGDVLVDLQRSPLGMPGDELQFGIGKPRIAGQPGDGLVAEGVRRAFDARLLGIQLEPVAALAAWRTCRSGGSGTTSGSGDGRRCGF